MFDCRLQVRLVQQNSGIHPVQPEIGQLVPFRRRHYGTNATGLAGSKFPFKNGSDG